MDQTTSFPDSQPPHASPIPALGYCLVVLYRQTIFWAIVLSLFRPWRLLPSYLSNSNMLFQSLWKILFFWRAEEAHALTHVEPGYVLPDLELGSLRLDLPLDTIFPRRKPTGPAPSRQSSLPSTSITRNLWQPSRYNLPETKATCHICTDEFPSSMMVKLTACDHAFCAECLRTYTSGKLKEKRYPISCPVCFMHGAKDVCELVKRSFRYFCLANDFIDITQDVFQQLNLCEQELDRLNEVQLEVHAVVLSCPRYGTSNSPDCDMLTKNNAAVETQCMSTVKSTSRKTTSFALYPTVNTDGVKVVRRELQWVLPIDVPRIKNWIGWSAKRVGSIVLVLLSRTPV